VASIEGVFESCRELSSEELERYSRQIPVIGCEKQLKLKESSVLVAGVGGLGSIILYYLVAAGIGRVVFIDDGIVELSNLQRQILFTTEDIGKPKVLVAENRLKALNPHIKLIPLQATITEDLLEKYIRDVDVVVDALDNWEARFVIDKIAWKYWKPIVHAGVGEYYGQLTVIKRGVTPCLRCLFRGVKSSSRGRVTVLATTPGILGLLEVNEVFKLLLGLSEPLYNKILVFNGKKPSIDIIEIKISDCSEICEN
jgi:molybdopterin/thiamine biosynthesis adenylyltransferase